MNSWKPKKIKLKKKQIVNKIPSYQDLLQVVEHYADTTIGDKAKECLGYKKTLAEHVRDCHKIINTWPKWKKRLLSVPFDPKIHCIVCKGKGKVWSSFDRDDVGCSECNSTGKKINNKA